MIVKLPLARTFLLFAILALASCAPKPKIVPEEIKSFRLDPITFSQLPGWQADNQADALPALRASCKRVLSRPSGTTVGTEWVPLSRGDWLGPCQALPANTVSGAQARAYLQKWFRPHKVSGSEGSAGLFTGYFEAEITGSRKRENGSQVPVYALPRDHVSVDLGKFDPKLKGKRIVGRVKGRHFVPYHKRGPIDLGALKGQGVELVWADDAIDLFLLHVQGSGRVRLRDGSVLRIGFSGHNGHGYRSIGSILIRRGELQRNQASWPKIRRWIESHPHQARTLLAENPRFIFFRRIKGKGPIGAQGVALTPRRSLAVDRAYIPFGVPVWLETHWPENSGRRLERLMVAQDTGDAIRGPVRGDFFWGFGKEAFRLAGSMKSRGQYYVLLPNAPK